MFRNYFKITSRYLLRNKGFSLTNILGLTLGITCTIFILLWVQDELSYNKFHRNYADIYQVMAHRDFNNQVFTDQNMVLPMAKTIQQEIPAIKNAVVTTHAGPHVLSRGDIKLKKDGYTVSEHFFDMFTWKFIKGNAATAIHDAYSIILTESTAKALFGKTDPINNTIKVDNEYDAVVTAVIEDVPGNSTFQFDFINAFNYDNDFLKRAMTNWVNSSWDVYVQTNPGTDMNTVNKKINEIKKNHDPSDKKISTYFGFPMSKWRLYSDFKDGQNTGGMIRYVKLFSIIAIIILLIACVNFMNLSTARSEKRAKEVGVRKTLGSGKKQLVTQFYFESILLTLVSFIVSILTVILLMPAFNHLVDKQLSLDFTNPAFWIISIIIIIFTGFISGSYPSLYLSSFNPIKVLKGSFLPGKSAVLPRRILVVAQFSISILLISATVVVYEQIRHVKDREIGYDPNNLIMVPAYPDVNNNFTVIRQELVNSGLVASVTRSMSPVTEIWWRSPAPEWEGKPADANLIFSGENADVNYASTLGIKFLEGKDFSGTPSDSSSIILNEAAVKAMGIKNPLGMKLRFGRNFTVIGVTENVVKGSPFEPVEPLMVFYGPNESNVVSIRLNQPAKLKQALQSIETTFKKYNPAFPFEYQFVDKEFAKKFITEDLIGKLSNLFAGLAIFICCIGLAGLASFTIDRRIKEIGIRKVLGASVQQVMLLISKEFVRLVLIAFIIAIPITWWLMNNWLEKYSIHIDLNIWMFFAVGILVLVLTLLVVFLNTARAALANPVKSLRTE